MDLSIYEYSSVSCDDVSLFAPYSLTSQIFDINDEIAQPDSGKDSFDHNSDPIDERVSPAIGDVEIVDFGTDDQPRELKIGLPLSTDERNRLIHLLRSYLDVFAWSYEDMPGLDPSIVKEEIQKQLSVGFISVVEVSRWLSNVVPVPKKDGKVRVCVDFRDLNKASPKDDFPLPHIDLLVDGTAGHSMLSFMDGFSGYNQILMASEDMEKTPLLLSGVLTVTGHMVSDRGIEVDPDKIKAILDMPVPRTEKRDQGFSGASHARASTSFISVSFRHGLGCMLAQLDDLGKERAIYYLTLVWATRRLRHYMTEYSVHLISRLDPLRYLFDRPALAGRLMRCVLPIIESRPIDDDFPDEEFVAMTRLSGWRMYFDGAANHSGMYPRLETALELGITQMDVLGDSNLVLRQVQELKYIHLPRAHNQFADALATLASTVNIPTNVVVRPLLIETRSAPAYCHLIDETEVQDDLPWFHDIRQFLRFGTYPEADS
ncbi:Transposon Ty3-I Gag-Pol polyprotein [Vitis vinifera]|uniref:Transposon Ty3-I Gag-Pol polyprotein n=1 Tax=Vitis vinifera TaxID=29760 RepID=A0A438J5C1_VITVI|nr:Transposon Ty3-I Gag-Pol polyprotein [Vitis vinifera]